MSKVTQLNSKCKTQNRDKQRGENELKQTSDYEAYREKVDQPVKRLRYWKTVRSDLKDVMEKDILPLQRK